MAATRDGPDEQATPTTAPATTAAPTSIASSTAAPETSEAPTAASPRSDVGPYQVATARVSSVDVTLDAPPGADSEEATSSSAPAYSERQDATLPLPRIEQPVQGRTATEDGYRFDNPQPFGDELTFLVIRRVGDSLQVHLPVRPNGTTGWVKAADVEVSEVTSHVEVNLAERTLRLFDGAELTSESPVAIGTNETRTPTGRHFISDKLEEPSGAQRYPWSLGISAYSEQLDTFDGGAPQIALHGWRDTSAFGKARSNGCIRVPDGVIEQLAALPLGTPVDVYAE